MKLSRFSLFLVGLALIGLFISLATQVPKSEAAFGVSPPWVRNDHLLPGTTYEQVINLNRSNPDQDMKASISISGDKEIEKWLKIEDVDNLIMRKGEKILPMKVIVKVPKRAAIRNYKGNISVVMESIESEGSREGGAVGIRLGAHIAVELSVVGEKITDYRIKSIALNTLNEGEPFYIDVEVENLGNTEINELNGQIDIHDYKETEVLKSLAFGTLSETVSPDARVKSRVDFDDLILDPGEYWIAIKVFKDGGVIYENRLYQQVIGEVVPVVTPEDAGVKRPVIPQLAEEEVEISLEEIPEAELREVAPAEEENRLFFIIALVGLGFGITALVAVIIVLIVVLKKQRQTALQQYISQSQEPPKENP